MAYIIERMETQELFNPGRSAEMYYAGGVDELPWGYEVGAPHKWCSYRYAATSFSEKKQAAIFANDIRCKQIDCRVTTL